MVNITIDGKQMTVEEGKTILEVAKANGIYIPTLCYHPKLRPIGSCRLCLVAIEGREKPVTACNTPVAEGMVVRTSTPEILEMRKGIINMILSMHPEDCLTCEKAGNCELQECAYNLGVKKGTLPLEAQELPVLKENPFIVRDYNKCIACGRCIRACKEVQCQRVLDLVGKGSEARAGATVGDQEITLEEAGCVFCGNCVQVCPVGALLEKDSLGKGRQWEAKKVRTVCTFCGVGCNLEVNVKDDHIVRVRGYENPLVNDGWLCVKGRFGNDFVESPERIKRPLIRVGEKGEGKFKEVSWEEALDYTAKRLQEVKDKYGKQSIAAFSSARCTNEENYLMQKFMRAVIGNNNIDHCART
ncbi:MAG: NADH-quinone oxidoreductase subunit [Clostridia bacterium]|nr:NADH-quinone oxidoreductase subunit [Clostridia bacterium]